jgi:Protein of unknown function (DUF1553)/Protein of unknown function (DUF1549)/Concanavalin A-like lectin/glucanases superfamily/Planctomycete cytochrome C
MNGRIATSHTLGRHVRLSLALWFAVCFVFPLLAGSLPDKVDFNYDIKPLLSDRCYACHGPDEKARKAKLRLDVKEGAFKALDEGMFVIKPGDLAKSEVYRRITTSDADDRMPPPKSNLSLSQDEVALLGRWIEQGAEWKRHWSFIPVSDVTAPQVNDNTWPRNEIDRFVLARLEREGLQPAKPASKERWLRRVTFDLTGLPPALDEIDAFMADNSPRACERVVDRLLASPAYGERMAVEWLDVARYADTYGYQADRFNHLWPWRDWVIAAFNRNLPFDQFILWQIAGDLLPDATREQKLATAFNRLHRQTNEGGSVEEEFRVEYNADRVHTTAAAFLGLTLECARCHDHKFDPITQKDYYRLFAFFNSTDESGLYSHFTDAIPSPTLLLFKDAAQESKEKELKRGIVAKEKTLAAHGTRAKGNFQKWLKETNELPALKGLIGLYTFDQIASNRVANVLGTNGPGKLSDSPKSVPGKFGQALLFNGENSVAIEKLADFKRTESFSFSLWLKIPDEGEEIVVLHHQQAGSDAGYQGYQLILENGKASFALVHFWPGNALKVRTREKLKIGEWTQCGVTYDGSSRAGGVSLYLDGRPVEVEVLRDSLFKDFANGSPLTLAARFRGRGFKGGQIDELKVFNRCLTPFEMAVAADVRGLLNIDGPAFPTLSPAEFAPWFVSRSAKAQLFDYYRASFDEGEARLAAELKKLREQENDLINSVKEIMIMGDRSVPRPTYVLKRGAYDAHGEAVEPGTPENIMSFDRKLPPNRLGLARWLVDPKNPLTARVTVNRYWQLFFGRGIVATPEDFGSQGMLATHPELLDWLAKHFMDSGWDLKALHKLIALSATYRQSSQAIPQLLARDPDNKLLARGPKGRLTAEMLRDSALAAAGLLVQKVGGPSVKPYQPQGLWEEKSSGWKYEADKGEGLYRRSLYTYWKRASQHPMMITFDGAERNTCIVRRQTTSTPLQALVLLNDPQFVEASRRMAQRAITEAGATLDNQIAYLFRLLTSREPNVRELAVLKGLYHEELELFRENEAGADQLLRIGESNSETSLQKAELAASAAVASVILNHDDATMKR